MRFLISHINDNTEGSSDVFLSVQCWSIPECDYTFLFYLLDNKRPFMVDCSVNKEDSKKSILGLKFWIAVTIMGVRTDVFNTRLDVTSEVSSFVA
jgi:hypothetical protein